MVGTVVIVNGYPLSGKDEFIDQCIALNMCTIYRKSSVDPCKDAAVALGYEGEKTEAYRKFVSECKKIWNKYLGGSIQYVVKLALTRNEDVMFIHIRECDEIFNVRQILGRMGIKCVVIKVVRPGVDNITSNDSDADIDKLTGYTTINNKGSKEDLKEVAMDFLNNLIGVNNV